MATAADIFSGVPREKLDSPITDIHVEQLSSKLKSWEKLVPYLGLSEAEEEEIRMDYQGRYGLQKREALRKWKRKQGSKAATYHQLIIVFCCAQQNEMAEKVKQLLVKPETSGTSNKVLESFRDYLIDCYTETPHPSHTQWPHFKMSSYIDLALREASDVDPTRSSSDRETESQSKPQPRKTVSLGELFTVGSHQAKRKVILIEGPAGCGKTTLTWHACREWAEGRFFTQLSLLIHLSLEDPAVQSALYSAKCLADIIPHESSEVREAIAGVISERRGEGVCFMFDSWDEAPQSLYSRANSYLYRFVAGTSTKMLPRCSIVIASRPVAVGLLYSILTARILVGGFDVTTMEDFIEASLDHDSKSKGELYCALRKQPQAVGLLSLPINTAIVVHLFHALNHKLPSTRTELFKSLVCNLLLRHMQLRTPHGLPQQEIEDLKMLPADTAQKLRVLCSLAFHGVMEGRRAFETEALHTLGIVPPLDTLGLLQVHQQLTGYGIRNHYGFLHYSVQEFLAAYHISQLSGSKQTKTIKRILYSAPLSPVLPFYAGLTKLSNDGACTVLVESVNQFQFDSVQQMVTMIPQTESSDMRRLLLALINCIYESQNVMICTLVAPFTPPHVIVYVTNKFAVDPRARYLYFNGLGLDISDCLSLGFFIKKCLGQQPLIVSLVGCFIGDTGVETLMRQLMQVDPLVSSKVSLLLDGNLMTHNAVKFISIVLREKSVLHAISFEDCWDPYLCNIQTALQYLIEGVSRNCLFTYLSIRDCCLGPLHAHHLILMITVCKNLQMLDISSNNLQTAIPLILKALEHSSITTLSMDDCGIGDQELLLLGESLETNKVLQTLSIIENPFSPSALTSFFNLIKGSSFKLRELILDYILTDEQENIYQQINVNRYPPLTVTVHESKYMQAALEVFEEQIEATPPHVLSRVDYPSIL